MTPTQTIQPRGKPVRDRRMYYSDEHRYVLAFCARLANRILQDRASVLVDPEELMAEGWWRCLRHREPGDLRPAIRHTVCVMVHYAVEFYVARYGRPRAHGIVDKEGRLAVENLPLPAPGPWERIVETETYQRQRTFARAALRQIDPRSRKIITQHILHGKPFTRMSREEGVCKETIQLRYHTAMKCVAAHCSQGEPE